MEKFAAAFKKVQKINKAIIGAVLLLMIGVVFLQTFCRFVIFKSLTCYGCDPERNRHLC